MKVRSSSLVSLFVVVSLLTGLVSSPLAAQESGGIYSDVVSQDGHAQAIKALHSVGLLVDTECADGAFCPDEPVQRWEMAVWLGRALYGTQDPQDSPSQFDDLGETPTWAAPYIDILVADEIIEECSADPLSFCPTGTLTRAEIATVLARGFDPPEAGFVGFGDLQSVANADDINSLAAAGITVGCSEDPFLYCPSGVLTRGQMAALLARALGLVPLPGYQPATDAAPLPTDPAVRVGTLDNGYTYYVRQNDKPGDSVTLRLVVQAGSVNDPEPDLGLAHFVEHMLFRGTEDYTTEEFNSTLRRLGVEFGPDANAYVSYDQTVYEISVTTDPVENVNTALHILSQMGHAALMEPEAVEAERGVVLDEVRFRTATASGQISAEFDRVYTQGTPYEGYYPIGTAAGVESITTEDLREFYETWYVPSNMAVVVVGDRPADELYALVENTSDQSSPAPHRTCLLTRSPPTGQRPSMW